MPDDVNKTPPRVIKIRRLPPMPKTGARLGYTGVGTDVSDD